MKVKFKGLSVITVFTLLLFYCGTATHVLAQDATSHIITLYVDTENITNQTVAEHSDFGQEDGVSNEEYLVTVNLGDTIIWKGVPKSIETDVVNITSINYQGGSRAFDSNVLRGNGETPETVTGVTTQVTERNNNFKYVVKFTVIHNGEKKPGTFQIDPELRVLQR